MTPEPFLDQLFHQTLPEQVALSPDGQRVAYVLRSVDAETDREVRSVWLVDSTRAPRQLTAGPTDTAPTWSPDGGRLAFLRSDGTRPPQVWVRPVGTGGQPVQVTDLELGAGTPAWNPDGSSLAFVAPVRAPGGPGPTSPTVANTLSYKADGIGYLRGIRRAIHVVDVASGDVRTLTCGDIDVTALAWSPDGRTLAVCGSAADSDLTLTGRIMTLRADGQETPRTVFEGHALMAPPLWDLGGDELFVVGRAEPLAGHQCLLQLSLTGREVRDLSGPLDRNVMPGGPGYPGGSPALSADGQHVLFCANDQGCARLFEVAIGGGPIRPLVRAGITSGLSAAAGKVATVHTTTTSFGEVALVDLATGAIDHLTGHAATPDGTVTPTRRWFELSDGSSVEGWLLTGADHEGPKPLLLDIHGGPHNAWHGEADPIHLYHQELVARGWVVLTINPRGSDGYGEAFFRAAVGAWGQADLRDFLEPVDQLVTEGVADPERLAVNGYSYGGFMVCQLTTLSGRFARAVAGGVVTDLTSMVGTSDMGWYTAVLEVGHAPWENPGHYRELSPISRVANVTTPTLVVQGADDLRCPVGQAEQWFNALRARGVESRLVLYPGSSHLFVLNGRPSHRHDWNRRIVEWVDQLPSPRTSISAVSEGTLQQAMSESALAHGVPGAVLGVLSLAETDAGDGVRIVTHGVMDADTGAPVTADTLFQIGSITKTWTASLVMALVDDGLIDLDEPIVTKLPDFMVHDDQVARTLTMRHLLSHTSGIDGDIFTDTGRGDDAVNKYVHALADVRQVHPLGAMSSYCNAGYVVAARVVEELCAATWDQCLQDRLIQPLGLRNTVTIPEDALVRRTARGHVTGTDGRQRPARVWSPTRSLGPAGAIACTMNDLLQFARLHFTGGRSAAGEQILSPASVKAMTVPAVDGPGHGSPTDSWGLGWACSTWGGESVYGHDGATVGQAAFLRLMPERGLALALFTNGGDAAGLWDQILRNVAAKTVGLQVPPPLAPVPGQAAEQASECVGIYGSDGVRVTVTLQDGNLAVHETVTGPLADVLPEREQSYTLAPISRHTYAYRKEGVTSWHPLSFISGPDGRMYMYAAKRAKPRIADAPAVGHG